MFATVLLYLIVAFVIFFTFLGIKRMFQVFFVSGRCCDSKKGLGSLRHGKNGCSCSNSKDGK